MELLYFISNQFKAGSRVPPHSHNCYELVYYLNCNSTIHWMNQEDLDSASQFNFGKQLFFKPTDSIELTENSFSIVPPKILHDEMHRSEGRVFAIGFQVSDSEKEMISSIQFLTSMIDSRTLINDVNEIANEFSLHASYSKQMLDCLLTRMLIKICRFSSSQPIEDKNLDYVNHYINQYFLTNIQIAELASQLNYSESHFRLLFKKKNGISIGQYIINKKIEYIKAGLVNPNLTIKQIADSLGFQDYYYFSSFFKKHSGYSPREYKALMKVTK